MNSPVTVVTKGDIVAGDSIRLNLGGRSTRIEGFKNVDLSEDHDVDYITDVSNLSMFEDGSIEEIYASQILEHFPHVRTESVLKEWHRVLEKGGKITIGVPDFARTVEIYLEHGLIDWVVNYLYGDQVYALAYHYAPFNFARLAKLLNGVGFLNIKRIGKMPYGINDCSGNIFNQDGKSVSLNVEAYK